jgi:hypothetical protein
VNLVSTLYKAAEEEKKAENSDRKKESHPTEIPPFREWSAEHWKVMWEKTRLIYTSMERNDAKARPGEQADSSPNEELITNSEYFEENRRFNHITRFFNLHQHMAPFRNQLELLVADDDANANDSDNKHLQTSAEFLDQFL